MTATKRTESLQTVGLSLTALGGDDLQARGATDFEDYAVAIPNVAFGATDDVHATAKYRRRLVRRLGRLAIEEARSCRS